MVFPHIDICERCGKAIHYPHHSSYVKFTYTIGTWGRPTFKEIRKVLCHKCAKALNEFLKGDN